MKRLGLLLSLALLVMLSSCKKEETMYENGTYRAEAKVFSHGWKEFMEVTITDDVATLVYFDAISEADGSLKSEVTEYPMPDPPGLPSAWYPTLEQQFEDTDIVNYDAGNIDGVSGATHTSDHAKEFFEMILEAAKDGDKSTQYPDVYVDGDYSAEAAEFSHGWKEFMSLTIVADVATMVNFDAMDSVGALKSELTEYPMPDPPGLPSAWYPTLEQQFVDADIVNYDVMDIDGVTGATHSSDHAKEFFELMLGAATYGDTSTQIPEVIEE